MYIAQLVRYLHSMHQVLDSISSPCSSNMVVDACKPSIWEMEAGGSEILLPSIFFNMHGKLLQTLFTLLFSEW